MVRIYKQQRVNEVDLRPRPCGRVNKGEEKGDYFGKDLNDKLRFHGCDTFVANAVYNAYTKHQHLLGGTEAENFAERKSLDVIVKHLNIVFPEEPDYVFDTSMKLWNGKGEVMRVCDRRTILQERIDYKDLNNQPCSRVKNITRECPLGKAESEGMAGLDTACPLGCVHESVLKFQIAELLMGGEFRHVTLTTHSWEDESGIAAQLELFKSVYGSIVHSEFEWKGIGKRIPFIMSRHEVKINRPNVDTKNKLNLEGRKIPVRTGGKSKSTHWAIAIKVNPFWHMAWTVWQEDKKAKYFGLQTSPKALIESGIIDAEIIETKAINQSTTLAIAPAVEDDSWKITAYEYGLQNGIDSTILSAMINTYDDRDVLREKIGGMVKIIKTQNQLVIAPTPEPLPEPIELSQEIVEGDLVEAPLDF